MRDLECGRACTDAESSQLANMSCAPASLASTALQRARSKPRKLFEFELWIAAGRLKLNFKSKRQQLKMMGFQRDAEFSAAEQSLAFKFDLHSGSSPEAPFFEC